MNGDTAVSGPCTSLEHRDHGPHPDCDQPWCTCPCHTTRSTPSLYAFPPTWSPGRYRRG